MELRQFQTFKTVVDLNSFTKAAQALQYSPATITSHIQQLEEEMGAPLFDRLGKTIQLTSVGRELVPFVEELLLAYDKIKYMAAGDQTLKGELRVGASETMMIAHKLGSVLATYKRLYPEVNLSFVDDDCLNLRRRIHAGELDIAIVLEPMVTDPQLVIEVFSEEPLVFIGGPDAGITRIEEADGECIVFSGKNCALRRYFEAFLMRKGIDTANSLEFSSMGAIKQCVMNGVGISLMPRIRVESLLREQKVKQLTSEEGEPLFYAQLIYHRNKWLSPAHQRFIACMLED
jgi:DNA-binding transcriptional LysR family regulator